MTTQRQRAALVVLQPNSRLRAKPVAGESLRAVIEIESLFELEHGGTPPHTSSDRRFQDSIQFTRCVLGKPGTVFAGERLPGNVMTCHPANRAALETTGFYH